jgi:hypothetical protein
MANIDDPKDWIVRLFRQAQRDEGPLCAIFPDGALIDELPLVPGERVYGVYKDTYSFTPLAVIVRTSTTYRRIAWKEVVACSSQHGDGQTYSTLTLEDGSRVRVRVGDMAKGWQGKISQLFHQMIERWSSAGMGPPLAPAADFFARGRERLGFGPNLEPPLSLEVVANVVSALEALPGRCFFDTGSDDEESAVALVVVTDAPPDVIESMIEPLRVSGVVPADEQTRRRLPVGVRDKSEGHAVVLPWD